ncbi:MAG: sugar ABC transporter permease [Candidatus Bathyarchaeia archaeon]
MSLARTVLFVVVAVSIEFGLGLLLATIFTRRFKFGEKRAFFSILLLPMMMMPIIVGYNFYMIFQPGGPLNYILSLIVRQPVEVNWLNDPLFAWISILVAEVWHWTPFMFLILLSGLVSLPQSPIDVAKVLGGTDWQIFKDIQLPMLKNIIIIAIVIRAMEAKNFFDEVFIMTRGGPGTATENISLWTYQFGAINVRLGYSSAGAIIILILTVLIITFAVRPVIKTMR